MQVFFGSSEALKVEVGGFSEMAVETLSVQGDFWVVLMSEAGFEDYTGFATLSEAREAAKVEAEAYGAELVSVA